MQGTETELNACGAAVLTPTHTSQLFAYMGAVQPLGPWVKYGVRSPKFIWTPVYRCTHWLRTHNSPSRPAFGLIYEGAKGQPR